MAPLRGYDGTPAVPVGAELGARSAESGGQKFIDADAALKAGDLGRYQTLVKEAQDLVTKAQTTLNAEGAARRAATTATTAPRSGAVTTTTTTRPKSGSALGQK